MNARPRRALLVSTSMQTRGGIATYVRMLSATELWARWQVEHVVTHRDGSTAMKVAAFLAGLRQYLTALLLRRPDVVHLHMSSRGSFVRKAVLFWLARAVRVPVVVHVHGSEFHLFHARLPGPMRALVRATLTRAAVVVALGRQWSERLAGIAPGCRLAIVPNAVRVPGAGAATARGNGPHVVFLGEIGERKGAYVLIDAWAQLAADGLVGPGTRLTLAGDRGGDRAKRLIDGHGVGESAAVSGWLPPAEVDELLGVADVLVLPSRNEGQPMAVLEAMARGVCVIAGDVGGIPEMIEHGRSGLLVPPDDVQALTAALRKVLTDESLRADLGAAARQRVLAEFDVDVVWRRIDALYREAARRCGG